MNDHDFGLSLGVSQFEKKEKERNARLKGDPENNTKSVTYVVCTFGLLIVI